MLAAAFLTSAIPAEKEMTVGAKAPDIVTVEGTNVVDDANSQTKSKVVSFWSPKNAASRIHNRDLSRLMSDDEMQDVEFISICLDADQDLMQEVMKIDGVNADIALSASQVAPRVFKDYGVEKNPAAFMISASGKITKIF